MVRCLSFHARYRCRHSGACCRAGWNIPFSVAEREAIEPLQLSRGGLVQRQGVTLAARRQDGACAFLDAAARRCVIHRDAGITALPLSCRMFPRIVLHDPRGTFVSLSHFCPTAASLLFEDGPPASIVDAPSPIVDVGPLDGLDAREELPPLLRPDVLMDFESYAMWEERAVTLLTTPVGPPRDVLGRLHEVTARVWSWSPGPTPLRDEVHEAFAAASDRDVGSVELAETRGVKRWLAARLFGTWIAYQGRGLETIVRYLYFCLDRLEAELAAGHDPKEAIRRSDYFLVHESDSQQIARDLSVGVTSL